MSQPKKTSKGIGILMVVLILSTIGMVVASKYTTTLLNKDKLINQGCNVKEHSEIKLTIQNDRINPAHFEGHRCDTVTITNLDDSTRIMAFGVHDSHVPYDGIGEKPLGKNQSFEFTLVKTGNFLLHDHNDEEVETNFTVN